jgi:hypothetical protein
VQPLLRQAAARRAQLSTETRIDVLETWFARAITVHREAVLLET